MCGRYYIEEETTKYIWSAFPSLKETFPITEKCDFMPSATANAIIAGGDAMTGSSLQWGFPGYDGKLLINARAETAAEKPTFADSVRERRCVLPAAGFYEWNRKKEKVSFFLEKKPVLYLAGIFRPYGDEMRFVILTREANESMLPVHDRMPLMIPEDAVEDWILDDKMTEEFLRQELPQLDSYQEYEQLTLF